MTAPGTEPPRGGLAARVGLGAMLLLAGNFANRIIGFVSLAILGRLLAPDDFGIVALALVVTGFIRAAVNDQFMMALIRGRDLDRGHYDTAFTLALIWGICAGAGIFLLAAPLSRLLETPEVADVLRVLALQPVIGGFRNPHFAKFMKQLKYGPNLVFSLGPRLAYTTVAIALASLWGSYWAMVIGTLAMSATAVAITHLMIPRSLRLSLARWREMLGFGGWLTAAGIARFASNKADTAIIGRLMDVKTVGLYSMGVELATIATQQMTSVIVQAAFPGMAAVSADRGRLWSAYLKVLEMTVGVMAPIALGIGLVAEEAVRLLIGPQWMGAVPVIAWLAPVTVLSALSTSAQTVATVEGRTRTLFLRAVAVFSVQVPLLILGISIFGLMGAVYARTVGMALGTGLTILMVTRLAEGRLSETLLRPWRSIVSAAVMAAAVTALDVMLLPPVSDAASALLGLVVKVGAGAVAYVAAHGLLWWMIGRPDGFERQILGMAGRIVRRRRR